MGGDRSWVGWEQLWKDFSLPIDIIAVGLQHQWPCYGFRPHPPTDEKSDGPRGVCFDRFWGERLVLGSGWIFSIHGSIEG